MTLWAGAMRTSATSAKRTCPPLGRVDRQVANAVDAVPRFGSAPDVDVVGLSVDEQVADLFAGQQGGRRAADVARFEAVALRRREIHFDLNLRHFGLELHVQIDDAGDVLEGLLHFVGLVVNVLQVGSIDADDKRLAWTRSAPRRCFR